MVAGKKNLYLYFFFYFNAIFFNTCIIIVVLPEVAPAFEEYTLDSPSAFVECPLCSELFSKETIEVHAAVCMV